MTNNRFGVTTSVTTTAALRQGLRRGLQAYTCTTPGPSTNRYISIRPLSQAIKAFIERQQYDTSVVLAGPIGIIHCPIHLGHLQPQVLPSRVARKPPASSGDLSHQGATAWGNFVEWWYRENEVLSGPRPLHPFSPGSAVSRLR